jgi:GTP pyrophosphokinase/guanosine-3',5'-bis(diphosphate) 3'-pyrophosphohydrolase
MSSDNAVTGHATAPTGTPSEAVLAPVLPQKTDEKPRTKTKILRQVELIDKVRAYDPTADEDLLNKAYVYAMRMHGAQLRASGDPYFAHPIQVAGILTEYHLDQAAIVTALLHDTIEDTPATHEEITQLFGLEIADLVEGVTKLTRLELKSEYTKQSENFRKFMLAISKDIRVLMVKLADRLHNMRTLHFVKPEKRERISRETLEVYAPLARQIGCNRFATELEDLAFSFIHPKAHQAIELRLEEMRREKGDAIINITKDIAAKLEKTGVVARVSGREKSPYSIWKKLQHKKMGFSQLSDIYAFRVVVKPNEDCYRVLGIIHSMWPCVQERFKDFISTPKSNNYQSLHTTVVGHKGTRIELQIRTEYQDRVAEEGVAAHWGYKNESYGFDETAATRISGRNPIASLRNIITIAQDGGDSEDWVEHAKMEMFLDQVFVFSPKGRLISLPYGAMPLDFAFAVHTTIGETAIGCMINGEHRPLRTILKNGDQVEILTGVESKVDADWLSLTVTGRAKAAIRRFLRQSAKDDFIKSGRQAIERGAARIEKTLDGISWRPALERFNTPNEETLFEWVGRGKITSAKVLEAIFPGQNIDQDMPITLLPRIRDGVGGMAYVRGSELGALKSTHAVRFSKCCYPVPGDRIIGFVDAQDVHVHAIDCERLEALDAQKDHWIDLHWTQIAENNALSVARLRISMENKPGVLGQACTLIGEAKGNIINIHITPRQLDFLDVDFDIEVVDAKHIAHISAALRTCKQIESVERYRGV